MFFKKISKTKNVYNFDRVWLVNELVLSFWALKRCAKFHSNPMILSSFLYDDNVKIQYIWSSSFTLDHMCSLRTFISFIPHDLMLQLI